MQGSTYCCVHVLRHHLTPSLECVRPVRWCAVDDDQPSAAHHVAQTDGVNLQDGHRSGQAHGAGHAQQGGVYLGCYGWGEGTAACLIWSVQIGLNNTRVVGVDAQYG